MSCVPNLNNHISLFQIEKKKAVEKQRRDALNQKYLEIVEQERLYFKTVKDFTEVGIGVVPLCFVFARFNFKKTLAFKAREYWHVNQLRLVLGIQRSNVEHAWLFQFFPTVRHAQNIAGKQKPLSHKRHDRN